MLKQEVNRFIDLGVPNLCDIEVLPFNGVNSTESMILMESIIYKEP